MWRSSRKERKTRGRAWQCRHQAGLWAGEEEKQQVRQVSAVPRAHKRPLQTAAPARRRELLLCPHAHSAHCFLMQFVFLFFSLLHVCNISSWLKKLFSFCGNMKALHYSALIPHGWRSTASLKSFPAVCNINSCTKMKLISFSETLLLTLNKVRGMGRNSGNNCLHGSRGITPQAPGPNLTDHFCPLPGQAKDSGVNWSTLVSPKSQNPEQL